MDMPSFEIRFDSKFSNRPCLPIAHRSQTTQTINGRSVVQYTDSLALWVIIHRYCLMCLRTGMRNM